MGIAVIKSGGKQYLVKDGDTVKLEKIKAQNGESLSFETLLTADEKGTSVEIGTPALKTSVKGTVAEQGKNKKITVIKYKAKTRYKKTTGHKQPFTKVKIAKV